LVYLVLGAYALGLPAATESRLLQAGLYAHGDARSPARFAFLRVAAATAVGVPAMLWLDRFTAGQVAEWLPGTQAAGIAASSSGLRLGAVGLALAASAAAWLEVVVLRRSVRRNVALPSGRDAWRFAFYALAAALLPLALLVAGPLASWPAPVRAALLLALFAAVYLLLARREAAARPLFGRFGRRA
jgi:peptidoglycan biosynthesis protein MviN/MurJ (putative lipid II flippase)